MIRYLDLEFVRLTIIPVIRNIFEQYHEPVPQYEDDIDGLRKLEGCLERVKFQYYSTLVSKAAALFISINLGHYFSNGNKRLALGVLVTFLVENHVHFLNLSSESYQQLITDLFPYYMVLHEQQLTGLDYGYYHLAVAVADSKRAGMLHETLKQRVEAFILATTDAERANSH
ncbi:hypothetical protein A3C17_03895 [Candidatus Uhrbacteria bacterium RIFCSPHIGHO2_02_FULL_53_13]|uniref:Fido domain-containing protein n=1 Tax=Candidatus Uhrbacteria bacterium RIFCSPHIGHO2_02_FULL_53_13 TaxID=1802389 RepID=A0A1F7TVF1_9BACT|nr:MAG: hypothetical protein A3C17_03895 [Candidatus Uhrbacteria bacterium RIFCSPHIGHO2_02_FULL_53_13]